MFDKVFELPLAKTYVRHWGVREAVRELIQNALDSSAPLEWSIRGNTLTITSKGIKLSANTLLLGTTSKADSDDTIGSFGEGYKIALLVLARDGYEVTVYNDDVVWTPAFKHSRMFGTEVLTVTETKNKEESVGLSFVICGILQEDLDGIITATLPMQVDGCGEVIPTTYGEILLERPKMLYVNGLLVGETEFQHGYNLKPQYLKLERDRQTVSDFDLAWRTKDMWFESKRWDDIVQMMEDECKDVKYANYSAPDLLKEACYKHFMEKNPGKLVATSQKELQKKVEEGLTNTVYVGGSYGLVLCESPQILAPKAAVTTPAVALSEWLEANRKDLRARAVINFKALLKQAQSWQNPN